MLALTVILSPIYWMIAGSLETEAELFALPPRWIWRPTVAACAEVR